MPSAAEIELRKEACDACGAAIGQPCTIMRRQPLTRRNTVGKPTAAHENRHEKLRRKKEGGTWRIVFIPDVLLAPRAESS